MALHSASPLPNFLLVGAAKSGTSSLANYLAQHPEIFFSEPKEPKYFSSRVVSFPHSGPRDHFVDAAMIKTTEAYQSLFAAAGKATALGEGSVEYLYYAEKVAPLILDELGQVKIIIVLRNPVERAYSNYLNLLRDGRETLSFAEALDAEAERAAKNYEFFWRYSAVGFYAEQVRVFKERFHEVYVGLFDDFIADTAAFTKDIYAFLGVDASFTPDTRAKSNRSGAPKNSFLHGLLVRENILKKTVRPLYHAFVGKKRRNALYMKALESSVRKAPMNPADRGRLIEVYRDDVYELSKIIDRDLSHWLAPA
jgi:hypothetical protein